MSYYAVESHGIVRSWAECQPLVHRRNLKYKKFSTQADAQAFLDNLTRPATSPLKHARSETDMTAIGVDEKRAKTEALEQQCRTATAYDAMREQQSADDAAKNRQDVEEDRRANRALLDFYTDGSHAKGTTRMGYGIYCAYGAHSYGLHQSVTPEWLALFLDHTAGIDWTKASNPTMELMAVVALLRLLLKHRDAIVKHCGSSVRVTIYHDYTGAAEWILGRWKARQPHIIVAVEEARRLYAQVIVTVPIDFVWVRGHSGVAGNVYADMLAGDELVVGLRPLDELFAFHSQD